MKRMDRPHGGGLAQRMCLGPCCVSCCATGQKPKTSAATVSVATQSLLMAGSVTGVVCAALVIRRTSVSNDWITERLAMGHPESMSQHVKRTRKEPKAARQLKTHEQALKSKD